MEWRRGREAQSAEGACASTSRLRPLSPVTSIFHSATNLSVSLGSCVCVLVAHRRMRERSGGETEGERRQRATWPLCCYS